MRPLEDLKGNRPLLFPYQITGLKPPLPPHRDQGFLNCESSPARLSLVFPCNANNRKSKGFNFFNRNGTENSTVYFPRGEDSNPGLHIERPPKKQTKPSVPMTFPDKTGTGDLKLDNNDITGAVVSSNSPFSDFGSHDDESVGFTSSRKDALKFPQNRDQRGKMKFPKIYGDNSSDDNRNGRQVSSFKFPVTDAGVPAYRSQK
ncbi:hypothetical protein L798_09726 [Zootermopsis nevadensis]|uniref:Uncharacterized protein n=2 Tax=Zootermopsis nevadensis TaxID=136037 RepID=A0A067RAK1_ZOONE|nr:hypothetical protein L798_09726 [Zootermopsis nevadensis]